MSVPQLHDACSPQQGCNIPNSRTRSSFEERGWRMADAGQDAAVDAGGFSGHDSAQHADVRKLLPNARAPLSRAVYGRNDDAASVLSSRLQRSSCRTIINVHRKALSRLLPAAASAAGLSVELRDVLVAAARTSVAQFRHTVAAAAAAAAQGQGAGAPSFHSGAAGASVPDLTPVLGEVRTLVSQHSGLWPCLWSHMQKLPPDSGQGATTRTQDVRILRACEGGGIATALSDAPRGESVQGILSRVQYGEESCSLDEDSMWFAKTQLWGEDAESDYQQSAIVRMQGSRKVAKDRRASLRALSTAAQRVNETHKHGDCLRAVVLLCPPGGSVEWLDPGEGVRMSPGEEWIPEVSDPPALSRITYRLCYMSNPCYGSCPSPLL